MKRFHVDEDWPKTKTKRAAYKNLAKYYRTFRRAYPWIPPNADFSIRCNIGALADVWRSKECAYFRFNAAYIKTYKLIVREFLHEMVHVIWPKQKHGLRFEQRIFMLRKQLFHDSMIIF